MPTNEKLSIKQQALRGTRSEVEEVFETVEELKNKYLNRFRDVWKSKTEKMFTFKLNPTFDESDPLHPSYYGWEKIGQLKNGDQLWGYFNIGEIEKKSLG